MMWPWLRKNYHQDKLKKTYGGPSLEFLDVFVSKLSANKEILIGKAHKNGRDEAAIMIVIHGRSATYQIGWSSFVGRNSCAHHLLLWQALSVLKKRGVKELDLGGFNNGSAAGIQKFKQGLGGEPYILVGHYT